MPDAACLADQLNRDDLSKRKLVVASTSAPLVVAEGGEIERFEIAPNPPHELVVFSVRIGSVPGQDALLADDTPNDLVVPRGAVSLDDVIDAMDRRAGRPKHPADSGEELPRGIGSQVLENRDRIDGIDARGRKARRFRSEPRPAETHAGKSPNDRRIIRGTVGFPLVRIDRRHAIPELREQRRHFRNARADFEQRRAGRQTTQNRFQRPRALNVLQISVGAAEPGQVIRAVAVVANGCLGEGGNRARFRVTRKNFPTPPQGENRGGPGTEKKASSPAPEAPQAHGAGFPMAVFYRLAEARRRTRGGSSSNMDWNGNVALVTGGSSGIGAALVTEIARRGGRVVAAARRLDRLERLASELSRSRGSVIPFACDVTRREDLDAAVARAMKEFGRLDTVIANAGFGVVGKFEGLTVEDYRRQFETNVFGVLQTAYAALVELKRSRGRLALIGSVAGYVPTPGSSPYSMSKFAIRALAGSLRNELAPQGISVTHIAPGFIESEIYQVDNAGRLHEDWKSPVPAWIRMDTRRAARQIASAIFRRRPELVVTAHGKAIVFLERHFPAILRAAFSLAPEERRKARAPSR